MQSKQIVIEKLRQRGFNAVESKSGIYEMLIDGEPRGYRTEWNGLSGKRAWTNVYAEDRDYHGALNKIRADDFRKAAKRSEQYLEWLQQRKAGWVKRPLIPIV